MKLFEPPDLLKQIGDLLDHERAALLVADFDALAILSRHKDGLLARIDEVTPEAGSEAIDRLRQTARRNQRMLLASMAGVKAAQQRFLEIKASRKILNTYDNHGRRQDIHCAGSTVERRA